MADSTGKQASSGPDCILLLVRHAHTGAGERVLCGWCDAPLSRLGWLQVQRLRSRLAADAGFGIVYGSPLRRSLETAQAVPAPHRGQIRVSDALREIYCGELEGLPLDRLQQDYRSLWQRNLAQNDENFRWPGGESYRDFRARVLEAVGRIADAHRGQRVLVFTHAGVINQVLGSLSGRSAARWEDYQPGHATVTTVAWTRGRRELIQYADARHLI